MDVCRLHSAQDSIVVYDKFGGCPICKLLKNLRQEIEAYKEETKEKDSIITTLRKGIQRMDKKQQ